MERKQNRVAEVFEPGGVRFLTRPVREPGPTEVLIKIVSSAICGSDLHIFHGRHPSVPLPVTIGHECSGDVIAAGGSVTGVKPGDRVTVEPVVVCGRCHACLTGNYGSCERISYTYRNGDGAMADYITVEERCAHVLPEHLSYDEGALIEPLSVGVHAVRRAGVKMGEKVAVIGAGAIGILIAALCKKCGASTVLIAGHNPARLRLALELGADVAVDTSREELEETVRRITGGAGVDQSFECVGLESTFRQAMSVLRRNGLATVAGIFENPEITISASRLVSHEIRVQGTQGYCWDFPVALEMAGKIGLAGLITHTFPLGELQRALELCGTPGSGTLKVILKP